MLMPQTPLRVAVQEDKQIKHDSHDREREAAGSSGNEPLFDIDEATQSRKSGWL
jgi:hypothetical protein